jgi:integrase
MDAIFYTSGYPFAKSPQERSSMSCKHTLELLLSTVYPLERPTTKESTRRKLAGHVNKFNQIMGELPAEEIDRTKLLEFRKHCVDRKLSTSTINSYIRSVTDLVRLAGVTIDSKRMKLQERDSPRPTPKSEQLSVIWRNTLRTRWPHVRRLNGRRIWCGCGSALWWRAVLLFEFCTGLRRADLFGLTWNSIEPTRIPTVNRKTNKVQYLPIPEPLHQWLSLLRRLKTTTVFGVNDRLAQIHREMSLLGESAGVAGFGCQAMRRVAANAFEKAHPGAGRLILNHGKTVTTTSYLESEEILREAATKLVYPAGFLEAPTLDRQLTLF